MENRELDAWIAKHVMGWERKPVIHGYDAWYYESNGRQGWSHTVSEWTAGQPPWEPSSRIEHAWRVVEKMESDGWLVHVGKIISEGFFRCDFATTELGDYGPVKSVYAESVTAPMAICLAARAAIEAKEEIGSNT